MSEKGWVYLDGDTIVYRASSLFSCLRSMVAARCGESHMGPHANIRAAMDASSGLEEVLLRRTAAELHGDLIWEQKEVELKIHISPVELPVTEVKLSESPLVIVRGHIDAMYQDGDEIIEAKALGDKLFGLFEDGYNAEGVLRALYNMGPIGDKYRWQLAVYGYATGRKVRFAIGHKVKITVPDSLGMQVDRVSPDPTTSWAIEEVIVTEPIDPESLVPLATIIDRIREIEEHAARDELPPCDMGCKEGDPYSEAHIFASATPGDADLENLLARYSAISDIIKQATDEKDSIRDQLIEQYGTGKHTAGVFNMNIIKVMSQRFDTKWLKKTMPDVYDQGLIPSESVRVNVTTAKGERDD